MTMSESMTAEVRPLSTAGSVTETPAVAWAANLAEKALGVPVFVVRISRDELFRAAYTGIDWLEGINQSSFKVARETVRQIDQLSRQAVGDVESLVGAFAKAIRGSGEAAGDMVSKTAVSLMGAKPSA
jgi:hypothetical protein